MQFRYHPEVEDKHAFLSPSKYHWVNYSDEKLLESLDKAMTAALGTRLHKLAHELIQLGQKLPNTHQTLNMYVNDCIGHRMKTEQALVVSMNAFGTADAINFTDDGLLQIFDLKNGSSPASEHQLEVYAAYFCIEYGYNPMEISYDLRIYQNDDIAEFNTNPVDVVYIIDQTKHFDKLIKEAKEV